MSAFHFVFEAPLELSKIWALFTIHSWTRLCLQDEGSLWFHFRFGNRGKSQGVMSGEYAAWDISTVFFYSKIQARSVSRCIVVKNHEVFRHESGYFCRAASPKLLQELMVHSTVEIEEHNEHYLHIRSNLSIFFGYEEIQDAFIGAIENSLHRKNCPTNQGPTFLWFIAFEITSKVIVERMSEMWNCWKHNPY